MKQKHYNRWSFYIILLCIGIGAYSLYSNVKNLWLIAPPNYVLLGVSIIALILGLKGLGYQKNKWVKVRSWVTITLSILTSLALALVFGFTAIFSFMGANEHIKTVSSPGNNYKIDFYRWDAGAAGSFGIRGELNGPLWFKKRIFIQQHLEDVNVEWKSDSQVLINHHLLDLDEGETYGYE